MGLTYRFVFLGVSVVDPVGEVTRPNGASGPGAPILWGCSVICVLVGLTRQIERTRQIEPDGRNGPNGRWLVTNQAPFGPGVTATGSDIETLKNESVNDSVYDNRHPRAIRTRAMPLPARARHTPPLPYDGRTMPRAAARARRCPTAPRPPRHARRRPARATRHKQQCRAHGAALPLGRQAMSAPSRADIRTRLGARLRADCGNWKGISPPIEIWCEGQLRVWRLRRRQIEKRQTWWKFLKRA